MSGGGGGGNPQQLNLFETTSIHFKRETQFPVSKFCFQLNIFCVRVAKFRESHGNISLKKSGQNKEIQLYVMGSKLVFVLALFKTFEISQIWQK